MTVPVAVLALLGCTVLGLVGDVLFGALFDSVFGRHADRVRLGGVWLFAVTWVVLAVALALNGGQTDLAWFSAVVALLAAVVAAAQTAAFRKAQPRPPRAHDPRRTQPGGQS